MVAKTMETFGRIDILINNAGALWWRNVTDTPVKKFDLVMDKRTRSLRDHLPLPAAYGEERLWAYHQYVPANRHGYVAWQSCLLHFRNSA